MAKTVLNVKTDAAVKKAAQKLSKEMGIPLSIIVTNSLKRFIDERRLVIEAPLVPSARLRKTIAQYRKDVASKNTKAFSPSFTNAEESIAWLNDSDA